MKTEIEIEKMIGHQQYWLDELRIQHSDLGHIGALSEKGYALIKEIARAEGRIEIMKKILS